MLFLKSFGIWLILAVSAIVVATFRVSVLLPQFGEQTAHQLGTILYLIVQFIIIYLFIRKIRIKDVKTLLGIGIFWVVITIIFEFVFGHYVMGHPWQKLFADYNLFNGRLWVLVLINNIVAPLISGKIIR
jgi:phosphatidylserine synthase